MNAIIMAAGTSSRFAPLSREKPKGLIEVRGEILIERQIRQLREAGIDEIVLILGYRKEQFEYLKAKFGVKMVFNPDYLTRNNNASIWAARDFLNNTYICSSDNYFAQNPFSDAENEAYYAGVYAKGDTKEWCMHESSDGFIEHVTIGGKDAWYMLGHAFWDSTFSQRFLSILEKEYELPQTASKYWENIFIEHLSELPMKIRKYPDDMIFEFDTLDELRSFDSSYWADSRCTLLRENAKALNCRERDITDIIAFHDGSADAAGYRFRKGSEHYEYRYDDKTLRRVDI